MSRTREPGRDPEGSPVSGPGPATERGGGMGGRPAASRPPAVLGFVYVAAMVMSGLDATIVNPALLTIGTDLGVAPAATNLVESAFLVSLSVAMPVAGWLCDRYGAARTFLAALAAFTAASALCGLAWNLAALVAFRVVQGVAGGLLTPAGMTMLFQAYPPERRMRLSRLLAIPTALAPAAGPILGGLLTEHATWRWAFLVNVPLGVLAVACGLRPLGRIGDRPPEASRLDRTGLLLAVPGFGMLLYALGDGPFRGWASPVILVPLLGGLALAACYVRTALRTPEPLLDLRLLRDRRYGAGTAVTSLAAAGLMGMLFVFPLRYQDELGASAADAGLVVFPEALGLMAASSVVDRVCARAGARPVIAAGLAGGAALFALLGLADLDPWSLRAAMFAVGFVLGHAVLAVQVAAFDTIPGDAMGRAMALFQSVRMLGGSLGVAACAIAAAASYAAGLLVAAGLLAVALGVTVAAAALGGRPAPAGAAEPSGPSGTAPPEPSPAEG